MRGIRFAEELSATTGVAIEAALGDRVVPIDPHAPSGASSSASSSARSGRPEQFERLSRQELGPNDALDLATQRGRRGERVAHTIDASLRF